MPACARPRTRSPAPGACSKRHTEEMASPRGFEPPTSGLGNRCSIQLSYGDVAKALTKKFRRVRLFRRRPDGTGYRDTSVLRSSGTLGQACRRGQSEELERLRAVAAIRVHELLRLPRAAP